MSQVGKARSVGKLQDVILRDLEYNKESMTILVPDLICLEEGVVLAIFKSLKKEKQLEFLLALQAMFDPRDFNKVRQIGIVLCFLTHDVHEPEQDPFCEIFKNPVIQKLFFDCAIELASAGNEDDILKASSLYCLLAHFGNPFAQLNYAMIRLHGADGLPVDNAEANKWLERATLQGITNVLEDPFPLISRRQAEIKSDRTEVKEAKQAVKIDHSKEKTPTKSNPSSFEDWSVLGLKLFGDASYIRGLSAKENAEHVVNDQKLCEQLTTRQFIRLLAYFKEEPDVIINLVNINLSRLDQTHLVAIGQYHAKVAAWIKTDCTTKLTDDNLAVMLSPFPELAWEFWRSKSTSALSNQCLLSLSLSNAELALKIYQSSGKQLQAAELGRIGEAHEPFAQHVVKIILTNWGKEHYSDEFVVIAVSYWVQKLEMAQLIVNHSGFKNALLTRQAAAMEIISDIGIFHPKLVLAHLLSLTTNQLQKWLHHFDIAVIVLTNFVLAEHLDHAEFVTEIALLHFELGKYILKNLSKNLSPQQLIKIGQAHPELAEFIIEQFELRKKLNEWQILEICKRQTSLKYKVLQYGFVTHVFDHVHDWSMARKIVSCPVFYKTVTPQGLFWLCHHYPDIGYLLYSLPKREREQALQRLSTHQQAALAMRNLYIANFYYGEGEFKDFTDIQVANILGAHPELFGKLAKPNNLHSRILNFESTAIEILCSRHIVFAHWVFYSHQDCYKKLFNSLSYECFSKVCVAHRSLAIRFFQDAVRKNLSPEKANFLEKMLASDRAWIARKLPEVEKVINRSVSFSSMESKHEHKAEALEMKREESQHRKQYFFTKSAKFYPFRQFILTNLAKHDVNAGGNCCGLVLDFLNFCLLHDRNPNLSYAIVLEKLKAGDLDEFDRIHYYQIQQNLYIEKSRILYNNKISKEEINEETLNIVVKNIFGLLKEHKTICLSNGEHDLGLAVNSQNEILFFEPNKGLFLYQEIDNSLLALLKDCLCRATKKPELHLTVRNFSQETLAIPKILKSLAERIPMFSVNIKSTPVEVKSFSEEKAIAVIEQKKYLAVATIAKEAQAKLKADDESDALTRLNFEVLANQLSQFEKQAAMAAALAKSCYLADCEQSNEVRRAAIEQHQTTLACVADKAFPKDGLYIRDIVRIKLHLAICLLHSGDKDKALQAFQEVEKYPNFCLLGFYELAEFCQSYLPLINDLKQIETIITQVMDFISKSNWPLVSIHELCLDFITMLRNRFKLKQVFACLQVFECPIVHCTWNLPIPNNHWFTARVELETLENSSGMSVIIGTGGIGKTQLAIYYIHHIKVPLRAWFNASDQATLLQEYRKFAQANKLKVEEKASEDEVICTVKEFISQHQYSVLIYDDTGDYYESIQKYLPSNREKCHIIITTRHRSWMDFGKSIEMKLFTPSEATALLKKIIQRESFSADEEQACVSLVVALGGLPLAISAASFYIYNCGIAISEYLKLYNKHPEELLSEYEDGWLHHGPAQSVSKTWNRSLLAMQREEKAVGVEESQKLCVILLQAMVALDSNTISRSLLQEWLQQSFSIGKYHCDLGIGDLMEHSLIDADPVAGTITLHPLLIRVVQLFGIPAADGTPIPALSEKSLALLRSLAAKKMAAQIPATNEKLPVLFPRLPENKSDAKLESKAPEITEDMLHIAFSLQKGQKVLLKDSTLTFTNTPTEKIREISKLLASSSGRSVEFEKNKILCSSDNLSKTIMEIHALRVISILQPAVLKL